MTSTFAKTTLAVAAWAAMTCTLASEETYVPPSTSTAPRAAVLADLAHAQAQGLLHSEEQTHVPESASTRSRSEVISDLEAWNRSGLAQEWQSNNTPDTGSASYRRKQRDYEQATTPSGPVPAR